MGRETTNICICTCKVGSFRISLSRLFCQLRWPRTIESLGKWPLMQESEVDIWPIPRKTSDKTIFYRFSWISLIFVKQLKATDWHIVISQWNILNCREKFTDKRYREIVRKRQEYARQNIRQENTCIGKLTSTVTLTSRGRVWSVWTNMLANFDVTRLHGVNFCQSRVYFCRFGSGLVRFNF